MNETRVNEEASAAPSEQRGFVGAIDGLHAGKLSGWAVTRFGDATEVTVLVNDTHSFVVTCDQPRPDLVAKQQSKGAGGWRIDLTAALTRPENRIEVRFADGSSLSGSPLLHGGPNRIEPSPDMLAETATKSGLRPRFLGAIDTPNDVRLSGWSVSSDGTAAPVTIQINRDPPLEIQADIPRPDLVAKGLSKGLGGWRIDVSNAMHPGVNRIVVSFPDGNPLPDSPILRTEGSADAVTADSIPGQERTLSRATPQDRFQAASGQHQAAAPVRLLPKKESSAAGQLRRGQPGSRPAKSLSLADLDELSLDDISLAVASGRVQTVPRQSLPDRPAATATAEATESPDEAETWPLEASVPTRRRGLLAKLFGRN